MVPFLLTFPPPREENMVVIFLLGRLSPSLTYYIRREERTHAYKVMQSAVEGYIM